MASSVEKEVGAAGADAGAGAGAGEEPLSLELPAPTGWKKKVPLLIPCLPSSLTIKFSFRNSCYPVPFCGFLLEFLWVSFVFVICVSLCYMVPQPRDFIFSFRICLWLIKLWRADYLCCEIRCKGLGFLTSEFGKLSLCRVLSRMLGFSRCVLCFCVRKGILIGLNCVPCNISFTCYLVAFVKFWKFLQGIAFIFAV